MSHYTTEVRFICETAAGLTESAELSQVDDIIDLARPTIFNNYPIFDEAYRSVLEHKILKHYYTREISEEVVGLWKLRLQTRMSEIMPYYNQLYKSELLTFNPLYDTDLTKTSSTNRNNDTKYDSVTLTDADTETTSTGIETADTNEIGSESNKTDLNRSNISVSSDSEKSSATNDGTTTTDTDASSTSIGSSEAQTDDIAWTKYSDTPQGTISNLNNDTYLTNATKNTDDKHTSETNADNTETDTHTVGTSNLNSNATTDKTSNTANDENSASTSDTVRSNSTDKSIARDSAENVSKNEAISRAGSSNLTSIEDYIDNVSGKSGSASYSKLLMEFRETFLNIDMMIINALSDLFFNLW